MNFRAVLDVVVFVTASYCCDKDAVMTLSHVKQGPIARRCYSWEPGEHYQSVKSASPSLLGENCG
jgi:hypothetical protein